MKDTTATGTIPERPTAEKRPPDQAAGRTARIIALVAAAAMLISLVSVWRGLVGSLQTLHYGALPAYAAALGAVLLCVGSLFPHRTPLSSWTMLIGGVIGCAASWLIFSRLSPAGFLDYPAALGTGCRAFATASTAGLSTGLWVSLMRSSRVRSAAEQSESAGMLVVFLVLFVGVSIWVPNFLTVQNMSGLAEAVSMVGMVSCTMLFCLASGHFDLSVESVVAMSGVLVAMVITGTGSIGVGVAAAILAGGLVGLVNGVVIAKFRINALITTLATMQIARGLAFIVSGGKAVTIANEDFFVLGQSTFLGVLMPVWITLACFLAFGILLNKTTFGRNTLAIGGNEEAARLAGIPVARIQMAIFLIQGLIAGFAGVILASRVTSGQPKTSEGFSLAVISACVLGGVSLSGGVGTMLGVVVGVMIMGMVRNAMDLLNISPFYQYVAWGVILLAAVLFDRYRQVRRAKPGQV